ncbi:transcription factor GTE6-like isoform X1 [Senna tora]|uniref:Transcription factor GTE6-like isoform X1 n=1 Tax=Senna tora TaxID=362788 RepID=A0A834WI09_9FABA|nr:transcription factor GTE6-like isoform X1 [Senna tora]
MALMQPVDVEGLGLHDYFEDVKKRPIMEDMKFVVLVIDKPMDFSAIKN